MLMAPPHGLLRGNRARSSTWTCRPASASVRAAVAPAGPPPTIRTSGTRAIVLSRAAGEGRVASPEGHQIGQQLVGAVGAGGELTP